MKVIAEDAAEVPRPVTSSTSIRGYRPELDVVRFLAFLLVFIHHRIAHVDIIGSSSSGVTRVVSAMIDSCGMGLCLFFTLSAFLITILLQKERDRYSVISVRLFYIRRVLRIWPLYIFAIAIGVAFALVQHQGQDLTRFAWYLLFAGNFYSALHGWTGNPMNPLWSISLQEQFYLIWPLAERWFSRRGLILCALFFIFIANLTLYILGERHANANTAVWTNTLVQFQMFAVGILLAMADKHARLRARWQGFILLLAAPLLWFTACFVFQVKRPPETPMAVNGAALMAGYALVALGCAAILKGFCILGPSLMPLWAANLGKISYGLYVYHLLAVTAVMSVFGCWNATFFKVARTLLALLLTIVAAKLSYAWLETPFLRLKRHFEVEHSRPI